MRHISLFLVLMLISTLQASAQRFLVSNEKENILYLHVQNPVGVMVDGVACSSLVVKTDNGMLSAVTSGEHSCQCTITPEIPGTATITLYKKLHNKLKKVGTMAFRVRSLPLPEPRIGNIDKPFCNKKVLLAMGGLRAIQTTNDICADFSVQRYKVTLIRNDSIVTAMINEGARYNDGLLKHLQSMEVNDHLIISDIVIQYYDGNPMPLQKKLFYTITK